MRLRIRFSLLVALPLCLAPLARLHAQTPVPDDGQVTKTAPVEERPDPLKRRLSDHEEAQRRKAIRNELSPEDKKWLNEDVRWIITDEEARAFKNLSNEEERQSFIESFWQRRNPSPDSPENEFRDEHYARIAYANEHFAAGKPGWLTDRGHIYIAFGTRPADRTSGPWKKVAAARPPSPLRCGTTGTWPVWATTSTLNS